MQTRMTSEGPLVISVAAVAHQVFCPRRCWLEYGEGDWADNQHTVRGDFEHRRVNQPGGVLGPPATEPEGPPWHARSLWLSEPALGLTGKLDLAESLGDGTCMPVDTKKGRSRDGELWPQHRVQLSLQALLLRAAGYHVESVAAWYVTERRRVVEPVTQESVASAVAAIAATRELLSDDARVAPHPLVDDARCLGCSLNVLCLPDEVGLLSTDEKGGATEQVRRVIPPRIDRLSLVVKEPGATVRRTKGELKVTSRRGDVLAQVGVEQVSHLSVYGSVVVTAPAVAICMELGIPICFFSMGGWYRGRTVGTSSRNAILRMAQHGAISTRADMGLEVARRLVADKIANSRTLLRRNAEMSTDDRRLMQLRGAVRRATTARGAEALLGVEGNAAREYWAVFSDLVRSTDARFGMQGRNRRPPRDRTNALLSYGYGLLVKDATLAVAVAGFDEFVGLYHTVHHGRPSMALDLMEPFRPLVVDSVVLGVIRRREITADDFVLAGQQVGIKPRGRKTLARAYERRMDEMVTHPVFGYRITYRQVLQVHARLVARYLMGELDQPPSFRTR